MLVVFLHGFLGSGKDWDKVINLLPFPCLTFDLPGHGTSSTDFDLFSAMKKLPPFHLVGYSMGGRLALQYPGPTESLTLLSTHLGLQTAKQRDERLKQDQAIAAEIRASPIDEFLIRWYDQPLFRSLHSRIDICQARKKQNREGLAFALTEFSLGKQADYSMKRATYLLGTEDGKFRGLYEKKPHILIPNAGHAAHLENPAQIAKEIYDHLLPYC
jgi:2-succinyl-6-hydroxy-2,4-cyclohexadiene-1-carboxylate synthase